MGKWDKVNPEKKSTLGLVGKSQPREKVNPEKKSTPEKVNPGKKSTLEKVNPGAIGIKSTLRKSQPWG